MHQAVVYIVESAVVFAVLVNFYKYACYRQTYYKWDRFFLIACIVICHLLPFCKISDNQKANYQINKPIIKNINVGTDTHTITIEREITFSTRIKKIINSTAFYNCLSILMVVYILGAVLKTTSIVLAFYKIKRKTRGITCTIYNNIKIYTIESQTPAFSFFDKIFVNKQFTNLDIKSQQIILNHECQHIKQHHTIDVLIFELLSIIQWFNPAVKQAAKLSRQICENIVDTSVSENMRKEYSLLLLTLCSSKPKSTLEPKQTTKNIKNRVLNIFSYDSAVSRKIRFASSLPILILLIVAYLVLGGKLTKNNNLPFPIKGGYSLAVEYFTNLVAPDNNAQYYNISHCEASFYTQKNTIVIAPISGKITEKNNSMVAITSGDTTIIISNLNNITLQNHIIQQQEIGRTMGDSNTLNIKTIIDNQAIDPLLLFDY